MANLFESETCSRCGGTGHYSYCQRWGTVCFKCAGRKEVLTKRGRAAQALYTRLLSKPLSSLKPGEQVLSEAMMTGGDFYSAWFKVEAARKDELNPGYVLEMVRVKRNGEVTDERTSFGGLTLDHTFRVRALDKNVREWAEIIAYAYQAILSKTGKEPAWLKTIAWG